MKKALWSLLLSLALLQGCSGNRTQPSVATPSTPTPEIQQSDTHHSDGQSSEQTEQGSTSEEVADISEEGVVGKDVPYVPTPYEAIESMLELAQVDGDDVVYDLGSGDGRIVIAAAQRGARAVGIELDPALILQSRRNAEAKKVSHLTEFRQEDIFETDFSEATVVTLYLLPSINSELRPKLLSLLKPGSRIISYTFPMDGWEPDQTELVAARPIYLWVVPTEADEETL